MDARKKSKDPRRLEQLRKAVQTAIVEYRGPNKELLKDEKIPASYIELQERVSNKYHPRRSQEQVVAPIITMRELREFLPRKPRLTKAEFSQVTFT